ncbi:MAG: FumA C-terminus/TtdB family hydratase beta subunit [Firmicutes bacterium]|nr:FumA C-terminus/TtdB family hydratase beta subunit [Bacillota bacterium]
MEFETKGSGAKPLELRLPLPEDLSFLRAGDQVLLFGPVLTARDAAHRRLVETWARGGEAPFPLEGETIYYVGPCPAPPGWIIGSAGPTTSGRMDQYTPALLARGLRGMIGKGPRSEEVVRAIAAHGAVYFATLGGAGALLAKCIRRVEEVAYHDLGPEAVRRLWLEGLPAVVAVDPHGRDLYREGPKEYARPTEGDSA